MTTERDVFLDEIATLIHQADRCGRRLTSSQADAHDLAAALDDLRAATRTALRQRRRAARRTLRAALARSDQALADLSAAPLFRGPTDTETPRRSTTPTVPAGQGGSRWDNPSPFPPHSQPIPTSTPNPDTPPPPPLTSGNTPDTPDQTPLLPPTPTHSHQAPVNREPQDPPLRSRGVPRHSHPDTGNDR